MERDADALTGLNEHEGRNRAEWNRIAPEWVAGAERNWSSEPHWGIWHVPEADLRALPMGLDGLDGLDAVELGCGTAYWSAWLARRGARPVGVDLSENQLATARAMQERHGLAFPLVHASAEAVPLDDDPVVEFHLGHGEMLDLLRATGFEDVRLREVHAPPGGDVEECRHYATRGWSQQWPVEEIWAARKR